MLSFDVYGGDNNATPLIIAHGLFGSKKNWKSMAKRLESTDRKIIVVDMRNHGSSFWHNDHTLKSMAFDLAQVAKMFGLKTDFLGHSMGGKATILLSQYFPELINRLIVVDVAPVKYDLNIDKIIDDLLSINVNKVFRREDVLEQLLSLGHTESFSLFVLQSLKKDLPNGYKWQLNLTSLKENSATLNNFPSAILPFKGKTLFIRGELSDFVSKSHENKISNYFLDFDITTICGAGHLVHIEKPDEFFKTILAFLK